MFTSVNVEDVLVSIGSEDLINTDQVNAFKDFVQTVLPQIRPSYLKRQSARRTANQLACLFNQASNRDTLIQMVSDENRSLFFSVSPDHPFIVDTIHMLLRSAGAQNLVGFNTTIGTRRNETNGDLLEVGAPFSDLENVESLVHVECIGTINHKVLHNTIENSLNLARIMTADFDQMTEIIEQTATRCSSAAKHQPNNADQIRETEDFLRWLLADNFVFMGLVHEGDRLGFANESAKPYWPHPMELWSKSQPEDIISFRKSPHNSPVHRKGRLDEMCINIPSENGKSRQLLIQGLFTYRGSSQPNRQIPALRQVLENLLKHKDYAPNSYLYKGFTNLFDTLPTETILLLKPNQILEMIDDILEGQQEREIRPHIVQIPKSEEAFVVILLPQHLWTEGLQTQLEKILRQETQATQHDANVTVGRNDTLLVHFNLSGCQPLDELQVIRLQ